MFAELDESAAGAATIRTLAAGGRWPAELAVLYRRYLDVIATAAGPEQVARAALASTRDMPLIIYLPRRLTRIELRFCEGMAARGQLHAVVALTGEQAADHDALAIRDDLAPVPATAAPPFPARARAQPRALPDAEEEARYAVRRIFAQLERRPGTRLDRIAIAYRATAPYARLVTEQLTAAGVPHHAPRQRPLACTVPGRTLVGLLRLPGTQWSRAAVLSWLRDAPVRVAGSRLPTATWSGVTTLAAGRPGDVNPKRAQVEQVLAGAAVAGAAALLVPDLGQGMPGLDAFAQRGPGTPGRGGLALAQPGEQRLVGVDGAAAPVAAGGQRARSGQAAQARLGKCTVLPG